MNDEGRLQYHFATPIYRARLDHRRLNPRIKAALDEFLPRYGTHTPAGWRCDVHSTYDNPTNIVELEGFSFLVDAVMPHIDRYLQSLNLPKPSEFAIIESWFNFYVQHDYQEYHKHIGSVVSGIYYYEVNIESSPTLFASPFKEDLETQVAFGLSDYLQSEELLEIAPRMGELVLFPGWLRHCVMPNRSEKVRGTFSFNATDTRRAKR